MDHAKRPWILIGALLLLAGCDNDLHDHPQLTTSKQLFEHHCAGCHNSSGSGNFLAGVPANRGTALTQGQISHLIRGQGTPNGVQMPTFPDMPAREAKLIAAYVKQLEATQPEEAAAPHYAWTEGAQSAASQR